MAQGPGDFAINLQEALVSPLQIRISQGIPPVSPAPANWRQSQARHFAGPLASNIDFGDKSAHSAQKAGISGRIVADHGPPQTPSGDRHCPEIQGSCTTVARPVKVGQKGLINLQFLFIRLFQDIQCVIFFDFPHGIIFVVLFMPECRHQSLRSNTHLRQDFPDNLLPHLGFLLLRKPCDFLPRIFQAPF